MFNRTNSFIMIILICLIGIASIRVTVATPIIKMDIRNHLFIPSEITIVENTKVKLLIYNHDESDEEFESSTLNREKIIPGHSKAIIFIGPLPVGEYSFEGEFFPKTARGKIIVKAQ